MLLEDSGENLIHVAQLALQRKAAGDSVLPSAAAISVSFWIAARKWILSSRPASRVLHQLVGLFRAACPPPPDRAAAGRKKRVRSSSPDCAASAPDRPAFCPPAGWSFKQVVGQNGGIRQDHALHGGMRNIASCHSAIFSNAACAFARTTRARPQICSQVTGLRLWGIAELPFCPRRSTPPLPGLPCAAGAALPVRFFPAPVTSASVATKLRVPVALDHLRRHRRRRESQTLADPLFRLRPDVRERAHRAGNLADAQVFRRGLADAPGCGPASSYQIASLSPNVIGSACTPCVRPICTVCWNSSARRFRTSRSRAARRSRMAKPASSAAPARYPPRRLR